MSNSSADVYCNGQVKNGHLFFKQLVSCVIIKIHRASVINGLMSAIYITKDDVNPINHYEEMWVRLVAPKLDAKADSRRRMKSPDILILAVPSPDS